MAQNNPYTVSPLGPNTLAIGTVTTLAPGAQATASVTGSAPNQTLNLGIPQGAVGPGENVFIGATSGSAGTFGAVPAPQAGDQGKYIRGDSTWQTLTASAVGLGNVANSAQVPIADYTAAGDILIATGAGAVTRLGVGSSSQIIGVSAGAPAWITPDHTTVGLGNVTNDAQVKLSTFTAAADIIYATGAGAVTRLGIGSTDQALLVEGGVPAWTSLTPSKVGLGNVSNQAQVPLADYSATGDILIATGSAAVTNLAVGTSSQILGVSSSSPAWITPTASTVGLGNVTNDKQAKDASLGAASGIATLNGSSLVVQNCANMNASLDTDGTMAANSDTHVPSQKAVVTYVAANASKSAGATLFQYYIGGN